MRPYLSSQILAAIAATVWVGIASAAQPAKLGYAETVIGGELVLVEETCTFHGLGTGYSLYLTNPRGLIIGKGCALADSPQPELVGMMVQWGASPTRGAESYPYDGFTWTPRGRKVMVHALKALNEAKIRLKAKQDAEAEEKAADAAMVAAFNKPESKKTYLGVVESKNYPPTLIITSKQCSIQVMEPDPSGKYSGVMVWKNNGRTTLGLSSSGDRVVDKWCALPNSKGGITINSYSNNPEAYTANQIRWEPKGQEWISSETER